MLVSFSKEKRAILIQFSETEMDNILKMCKKHKCTIAQWIRSRTDHLLKDTISFGNIHEE